VLACPYHRPLRIQAATDPYQSWMHDWLALDWGQKCRYQREMLRLPPASPHRVVFIGDSNLRGVGVNEPDFFIDDILDRGISGQTTAQMLVRLRADVLELHPAVVHIMAGTNDIAGNTGPTSLADIQGNIASMVEQARAHGARVILASVPPAAKIPWRPEVRPLPSVVAMKRLAARLRRARTPGLRRLLQRAERWPGRLQGRARAGRCASECSRLRGDAAARRCRDPQGAG